MSAKVLTLDNLSTDDFIAQGNKIGVKQVRDTYPLIFNSGYDPIEANNSTFRRLLTVQNNFGIIHLDFIKSRYGDSHIATLPSNAPTPYTLTEIQVENATIWIEKGSRNIYEVGLARGQRYILNLVGFFDF